jgi:hypothetical protein
VTELVGLSPPGSAVHLLGMAHLVTAAADVWGAGDIRVEGALQGLLKVGCLQSGVHGVSGCIYVGMVWLFMSWGMTRTWCGHACVAWGTYMPACPAISVGDGSGCRH